MLLTTTEQVMGREYDILGLVKGATIQSKNIGRDFGAGLKSIVGGELTGYTEMMEEARDIAMQRMEEEAKRLGADGIVGIRFSTSAIMQGAAEVMAYGTAENSNDIKGRRGWKQCICGLMKMATSLRKNSRKIGRTSAFLRMI